MEEKKTYIIGKVKIGTDEYRDLIEEVAESRQSASKWSDKYYTEHWELERVKKELTSALIRLSNLNDFINSNEEMKAKYKLFLAEQQLKEQGGEENNV